MTRSSMRILCYSVALIVAGTAFSAFAEMYNIGAGEAPNDLVMILSDNFDDGSISDWTTDAGGGSVSPTTSHCVSPAFSLGLVKQPAKKTCSASHGLGSTPNMNKRLYLDVDMMCWNSAGMTDLYLNLLSGNKEMLTLAFHWSCIGWYDGYWHPICGFVPSSAGSGDMWYHIKVVADMNSGTFDIYVTGGDSAHSGSAHGVPFRGSTHAIDTITFQAGWILMDNGGGEAYWIDNLLVKA